AIAVQAALDAEAARDEILDEIDFTGAVNGDLLQHNGSEFVPISVDTVVDQSQLRTDFDSITELRPFPNLFDESKIVQESYVNSSGNIVPIAVGWSRSDWIPVTAGQTYTLQGVRGRTGLAFYGAYGDTTGLSGSYISSGTMPNTFVAPAGANFVVF